MADRRMFSLKVINSAKFLKMPIDAQNLYFHLGLRADDDGIVEAYPVMRMIGSTEDNLKILQAKSFVNVLNEDLVSYITDWLEHNKIRPDRKINSIYKDLLVQILPDVKLIAPTERADRKKNDDMDVHGTSHGQPMDGIGKDRLGKDRLGKDNNNNISTNVDIAEQSSTELRNDKKIMVPYLKIMELYNSISTLPKIKEMTKARQETIRVWYKSTPDITIFEDYFKKVQASDFLTGRDGKWLKCGFDWIIKPSNRQKVLEGNYDNKKNNASTKESGGVIHGGEYVDFNKLLSGNR
jgi:hypothetical protein